MNNTIKFIFTFTLGAAVGVVATQKFFKTKYAAIAQEEIDSVKEVYSKRKENEVNKNDTPEDDGDHYLDPKEIEAYEHMLNNEKYTNNEKKGGSNMDPQVIYPEEFGYNDDYETITLFCLEDGVIIDDQEVPIEDPENTVGEDIQCHFGEYEDDTVYVINDRLKCYYEVCRDYRKYSDLEGTTE